MIKNRKSFISYKPINLYLKGLRHKHKNGNLYLLFIYYLLCFGQYYYYFFSRCDVFKRFNCFFMLLMLNLVVEKIEI